ncbi:MAG: AAA family ATPase [Pseudomonadota bacterium]
MLTCLAISEYRSLRDVVLPLERLTVVTGPNGSGKSNLYRALRLLAQVPQAGVIGALAREGGVQAALWAGPESRIPAHHPTQGTVRRKPVSLKLGFGGEEYGYALDLGLPVSGRSLFALDPEIKTEALWLGPRHTPRAMIAERKGPSVTAKDRSGQRVQVATDLAPSDSMLTHAADPATVPEMFALRTRMAGWRFYDQLRTDRDAPARLAHVGTRTPALSEDGADLAAALQTILEIGDAPALAAAIDDAFPGAAVQVEEACGLFSVALTQPGLLRPMAASELSDGTMRFVLLAAALLSPRPPEVLVLNEPETSLHPSLLPALARLILRASDQSQVIVVSHADRLVAELLSEEVCLLHRLEKRNGETVVIDEDRPSWSWPKR